MWPPERFYLTMALDVVTAFLSATAEHSRPCLLRVLHIHGPVWRSFAWGPYLPRRKGALTLDAPTAMLLGSARSSRSTRLGLVLLPGLGA